jgi:hypothetical protein
MVDGREPAPLDLDRMTPKATAVRGSWDNTVEALERSKLSLSSHTGSDAYKSIGRLGQWYLDAANETDNFRRFMWSYIGLEILADAVASVGRAHLTEQLAKASTLGSRTVKELLWPPSVSEADPNRGVRFRFALTAAILSPSSAEADTSTFARINAYRNTIHGRMLPSSDPPSVLAFHLFEKYCGLAARYLAGDHS